ncbi:MAG: PAS domain S-box protein [Planctomycetes bacterium]|nr:PAS domain S-box protein [Planctomycetota bacterium]
MSKSPETKGKRLNLLSNPLVGVYQSTLKGEFLYVNPTLAKMLGYASADELMRVKVADTYASPANRAAFITELKKSGSVNSFENELKTKSGQIRHVLTSGALDNDVISGVIMDVTERKDIEQKLIDSEVRYRTIVENTENLITWVDKDGRFLFVNHAARQILGLSPKECIGRSAFDFVHPNDKQATIDAFKKWLASKDEAFYFENRQVGKKGAVTQMSWVIKVLRDEKKQVVGFLNVAHDITRRKRATGALLESQRQIEFILGAAHTGLDIIDREYNLRYVDPAWAKTLGDWTGRKCYEYFMKLSSPCPTCDVAGVVASKQPSVKDGELADESGRHTQVTSIPYQGKDGEWLVAQVNVDITERKQAEESLKMHSVLLDNSTDSIFLNDEKGRFIYANKAAYETRGYTKEEFLSMTLADLDTPEDAKLIESRMRQIKENGRGRFEVGHRCKDGSVMPVEVHSSLVELGGKRYFLAVMRDIAEHKQSLEQTRRSHDTQAAINTLLNLSLQDIPVDSILNETLDIILSVPWLSFGSQGCIFLIDEQTRLLKMKIQRGLNPALQEICASLQLGKCLCGKAAKERKTQFVRSVDKSHEVTYKGMPPHGHYCVPIHTRDRTLGVINIYLKDGHSYSQKEVDFLETISKTLAGIISRQEIIKEKESVQSQFLHAQKMEAIGILAGGIAHDFNNILAAVRGYAELSLMDTDKANPLYENLRHVVSASDRGKNLTNQLLLFSRKQSINPKVCDLNELISNLLKMLGRLIGDNFHIETDLSKNLYRIKADFGNLEQVIMNLALNSRDAMPKGGRITIKTENTAIGKEYCEVNLEAKPGNFVCLSVADTGTGMTKDVLSHIFEPFFTTKEKGKGTGLGLSVVYGIVKQHQGWIHVYSEPDKGSVFRIYLPASDEAAQHKSDTLIISPADYKGNQERILVLEDDADIRKLVLSVLTRMNYQVFPASTLAEARQVFEQEKGRFHMILSDMNLPDGNGLDLCDELTVKNKDIKVLLSSGYPSREESREVIRQRGLPFIAKPYNLVLLFKTMRDVLEGRT